MAKQTVNLGTSPNKGDGDPIRTAMGKINDNFDELYAGNFADPENTAASIIPSQDGTYDIGSADKQWADLYVKDFIYIGGVRLEASAGTILIGGDVVAREDTVGSLFGDDSTILVDGISNTINLNGTIADDIIPNANEAYDLGSASNRFRDLYLSGSTIDLGGLEISNADGELQLGGVKIPTQTDLDNAVGASTGDLTGSVFADDSTLLVDGVNGIIPWSVISDVQVTESDLLVDWAEIVGSAIQFNGLPVNTFTTGDLEVRGTLNAQDGSDFELSSTEGVNINTSVGVENHTFEFMNDGTFYMAKNPTGNQSIISTPRNDSNANLVLTGAIDVKIETNEGAGSIERWTFGADGTLEFPDGSTQTTAYTGPQTSFTGDISIGEVSSGQTDIYGNVEFNNGTTAFQSGNSVDFNTDVDFNDVVKFAKTTTTGDDDNPTLTLIDVNSSSVQVLTSNSTSTNNWELPDGSEGQIMHFVAGGAGGSGANHKIKINNWWKRDGDTGGWSSVTGYWDVFAIYGFAGRADTGMATAIFVDGAWRTTSPWVD